LRWGEDGGVDSAGGGAYNLPTDCGVEQPG